MEKANLYTPNNIYVLQAKYAQPLQQGNSRWIVVNPTTKTLCGAVGKDIFPPLLDILKQGSSREGCLYETKYQAICDSGLLTSAKPNPNNQPTSFSQFYHNFVANYPFNNYNTRQRFSKDREQMAEYGKISKPPPFIRAELRVKGKYCCPARTIKILKTRAAKLV